MSTPVWIGLGSNIGDRAAHLAFAVSELQKSFTVSALSPLYETAPMYLVDQPRFLNAAACLTTDQGPITVLKTLKSIEAMLPRTPKPRYGPREIDLDLLAYGSLNYMGPTLSIPHQKIVERRFVLQPLSDIAQHIIGIGELKAVLAGTENQAGEISGFASDEWEKLRQQIG